MPLPPIRTASARAAVRVAIVLCAAASAIAPQPLIAQSPRATVDSSASRHAILPASRDGLERMHAVESDVAWARVHVRGAKPATLAERMSAYRVHGLSIAVIRDFQIEWAKGYGWADVAAQTPVDAQTLFEPGSISKALNAVGIMRLAQDGRLALHADVNRYLTSWKFPYAMLTKGKRITLAAILSHTAGLSVHGFWGYRPGDVLPTVAQILDGASPANSDAVRSLFPPGVRYEYSGGGTMISQQLVMDVSHQPYADFMRQYVLAPLGMLSSSYQQPPSPSGATRRATGYNTLGTPIPGGFPVMPEQAAAGLWTTASDLARFVIEVQRALRGDSGTVIDRAHAELMCTPVLKGSPGMGLFVIDTAGVRYCEHGAGNLGMSGELIGSASEGWGVVVVQNGESAELLQEVVRTVARVYRWPALARAPAPERATVRLPVTTLDRYVGAYVAGDAVITVVRRGDSLMFQGPGAPVPMLFTSPLDFFTPDSPAYKRFVVDRAGAVTTLVLLSGGKVVARASRAPDVALAPSVAQRYAGTYRTTRGDPLRIVLRNKSLWLESDGAVRRMFFRSATEFYTVEDFGVGMRVATTASGRLTGIWQSFGGERFFARRESR